MSTISLPEGVELAGGGPEWVLSPEALSFVALLQRELGGRRDELLDHFAACIDALVREDLEEPPSAIAAAGVVGGIESVLYARLQKGEVGDLDALLPSLMYFAVLAYAGREAAGEELDDAALA